MKIGVLIPSQDMVNAGFAYDLARLTAYIAAKHHPRHSVYILNHRGTLIADQREAMAELAIAKGCERLLWLDADMRFPKDLFDRLERHGKEFVAANYTTRREPIHAVASRSTKGPWLPVETTAASHGIEEVSAVGLGVCLMHHGLLRRLPKPWFHIGYHADIHQYYGEDVWFCRMAEAHGCKILIDHDLSKEVRHVGMYDYKFDVEVKDGIDNQLLDVAV